MRKHFSFIEEYCTPQPFRETSWCRYYERIIPDEKNSDGTYGVECPKTCEYAQRREKEKKGVESRL